ncbi:MAG: YkgJ family cysteine cluster protein [Chlorobi bacterium]|jgi:Fe-S-cluster containining protein|nr:YkgJ family cysteine cluster protein [Chlorobiota bacterium]
MATSTFNCLECIGYCCAIYERVKVTQKDIRRLAKHFQISAAEARERFTKVWSPREQVLRRTPDPIFGESCIFQDPAKRLCSIYEARPETCRQWPSHGGGGCVYYDVLKFEEHQQGGRDFLPIVTFIQLPATPSNAEKNHGK